MHCDSTHDGYSGKSCVDENLVWKDQMANLADLQWRLIQIFAIEVGSITSNSNG